jgi:MFS family permease
MALSNVALFGGAFLTPVFAGKITHTLGWQWTFYFVAIFTGVALPFMFFFVPETAFRRPEYLNTDFLGDGDPSQRPRGGGEQSDSQVPIHDVEKENGHASQPADGMVSSAVVEKAGPANPRRRAEQKNGPTKASFVPSLKLINGRKTDEDFFKLLLRPFPLFLHPGILWVSYLSRPSPWDTTLMRVFAGLLDARCFNRMDRVYRSGPCGDLLGSTVVV